MKEIKKETEDGKIIMVDMRRHILNVASALMTSKGIKETALKDIAKEAGISKGTLYYYYSAKEDIIYDIADSNLSDITTELLSFLDDSSQSREPSVILKALFEKILAQQTRGRLHLYLLNNVAANEALKEKFYKRYESWRDLLEVSMKKILGDRPDNRCLATVILAVLDGLLIQKSCGCTDYSIDEVVKLLVP